MSKGIIEVAEKRNLNLSPPSLVNHRNREFVDIFSANSLFSLDFFVKSH